jgi:hypothetical protein
VRPHEALDQKRPADVYTPSDRKLPAVLPDLVYPLHDDAVRVSNWGEIKIPGVGPVKLTAALAGQGWSDMQRCVGKTVDWAHDS